MSIENLNLIKNLDNFDSFCSRVEVEIGLLGGRKFRYLQGHFEVKFSLNELTKKLFLLSEQSTDSIKIKSCIDKIKNLDDLGHSQFNQANLLQKILTIFRRIPNLFYNRNQVLDEITRKITKNVTTSSSIIKAELPPIIKAELPPIIAPPLSGNAQAILKQNPFIHGTNSSIFALLPKTEHQLVSVENLLFKGLAPYTGEIDLGGHNAYITTGDTCFGKLQGCMYSLKEVLGYAEGIKPSTSLKASAKKFEDAFEQLHLTRALIHLTRIKMMEPSSLKEMPFNQRKEIISCLERINKEIANTYYLAPFLARFVTPEINNLSFNKDIQKFNDTLQKLISTHAIDIADYAFLDELPKNDPRIETLRIFFKSYSYELNDKAKDKDDSERDNTSALESFYNSMNRSDCMENFLHMSLNYPQKIINALPTIKNKLSSFIARVNSTTKQIEKMLLSDDEDFNPTLSSHEADFVKNSFGVIFICDKKNEKNFYNVQFKEYRSKNSLKLGREITLIATRAENMERVQAYIKRHDISGIEVIAMESLIEFDASTKLTFR